MFLLPLLYLYLFSNYICSDISEVTYIENLHGFNDHFVINSETNEKLQSLKLNLAMYNKSICGINVYEYNILQHGSKIFDFNNRIGPSIEQKVMGGRNVDITSESWSVQIYLLNKYICGGTLVSRNYVMTAAHCIIEKCHAWKIDKFIIQTLEILINFPGNEVNNYLDRTLEGFQLPFLRRRVRSITLPSITDGENTKCQGKNDFAILELNEFIPEGYGYACIPIYHPPMYTIYSSEFYVIGYGRNPYREIKMMLNHNKALHNSFDKDNLFVYDKNKIQKLEVGLIFTFPACRLKLSIPADEGYLCVYDKVDEGICDGDSGNGLFIKHKDIGNDKQKQAYIVGIVSKAVPCLEGKDWVVTNYQLYTDVFQQSRVYEKLFPKDKKN